MAYLTPQACDAVYRNSDQEARAFEALQESVESSMSLPQKGQLANTWKTC